MNSLIAVILSSLMLATLAGCSNMLVPPEPLSEPVTVHLLDHGRHPSLVMPGHEGNWVRYVHGEWRWYAKHETGALRALEALFWPTRAAIGRRQLSRIPEPGRISNEIPEGFVGIYSFSVERQRMISLRRDLDRHFESPELSYYQPRYNLDFVPYPGSYTLFSNSNLKTAQWLERMEVEVEGIALFSRWRVAESGPDNAEP